MVISVSDYGTAGKSSEEGKGDSVHEDILVFTYYSVDSWSET